MLIARTIGLLMASNIFMTIAWYGHLKFRSWPLWQVILVSWGIAFFEYLIQVPANRWGYTVLSGYQLKVLQECITFLVFIGFAFFYLGEPPKLKYFISVALIITAVAISFYER